MSRAYSEPEHELDVRPKRLSRPPRHLEDYEVEYRGFQDTYPPLSRAPPEPRHSESEIQSTSYQIEGAAKMTPLTSWRETGSEDGAEDIREPYVDRNAQMMIQKLREENRHPHETIEDLKRSSRRDETDFSPCPSPLPRNYLLRRVEMRDETVPQMRVPPVPAPRSNKSLIVQVSEQTSENLVADDGTARAAVEEFDHEATLTGDLSNLRLQSTPRSRHMHNHPRPPGTLQPQQATSAHPAHGPSYSHDQRNIPPKPQVRSLPPLPDSHTRERTDDPRPHYQPRDFVSHSPPPLTRESIYRGPTPSIPDFTSEDPRQFARLKISLDNLLPLDAIEQFKYQILLEHLKFEEALLVADSYSNSRNPYTQTM